MTWLLRFSSYQSPDDIFNFIVSGQKTIETRPINPTSRRNYANIKVGDTLILYSPKSRRKLTKTVSFVHVYSKLADMLNSEPASKILPSINSSQELLSVYDQLKAKWGPKYTDNLDRHGIVAIGFE